MTARDPKLQPPVDVNGVRVELEVAPDAAPLDLRWFARWLQKVLEEPGAPEDGRRP